MSKPIESISGELASVTGAILAGGFGSRLRSVVADRPKVLAEIHGRPFLAYLLDRLIASGMTHVVLCTGYLGVQIKEVFGNRYGDLRLNYSQEPEPRGTAGALRLAAPLFESDRVLVMNGDSFCEADLIALWRSHQARNAVGTLLLTNVADTRRYGRVEIDADGRILRFDEKDESSGPGWINAGTYVLNQQLLSTIPASGAVSLEREMFPAWIEQGLYGFESQDQFLDIGTPETYAAAGGVFASGSPT